MQSISLKAVLISSIASFVLMLIFMMALGALFALSFEPGTSDTEIASAFEGSWISMLALTSCVVAGYLGAHLGKTRPVLHGALSSSLNVAWGLICLFVLMPFSMTLVFVLIANPLLGALGGYGYLSLRKH